MDGPGIDSRWEARFSSPVQTGPVAHPASYTRGNRLLSPEVKRSGRDFDQLLPFRAEVKENVDLDVYSPSGLSWPALG